MNALKDKNKRKGIIGTILLHSLLLIAFLFMGLTYQDPPPPEEGININFGFNDKGEEDVNPEETKEVTEIIEKEVVKEQPKNTEEVIVKTEINNLSVEKNKKKKEKKPLKKEIIEEEPKVNKRAIYTGKKENQNKSEGNQEVSEGDQGVSEGDLNSDLYEGGGIGKDGTAYQLGGRKAIAKPKPQGNQIEGKVVVIITVNRLGHVTYANPGAQGSTTLNKELLERARKAALETKFDAKENAAENQQGRIIYDFRLN